MPDIEHIAVLDDDPRDLEVLAGVLRDLGKTDLGLFTSPEKFLEAAAREPRFDAAFLDVYLEDRSGVDVAESLKKVCPATRIVFVTTSREHALDAYRVGAAHYIVKPVQSRDVSEALRRASFIEPSARSTLMLHVGRRSHRVYLDEIVSVQYVRHAVEVTTSNGGCFRVWTPISEMSGLLDDTFLKVNRGTIVNMSRITRMEPDACIMSDGSSFPISRSERPKARERYNEFLVRELQDMVKSKHGGTQ